MPIWYSHQKRRQLGDDVVGQPGVGAFHHLGVQLDDLVAQGLGFPAEWIERADRVRDSAEDRSREIVEGFARDDHRTDDPTEPRRQVAFAGEQGSDGREVELVRVPVEKWVVG
jgi:hypothetical protein